MLEESTDWLVKKSAFSTLLRKGMKSKLQILRQMILCIDYERERQILMYGAGINVTIETVDDICKSVIWQSSFTKCSFDYFVPNDVDVDKLSCESDILK